MKLYYQTIKILQIKKKEKCEKSVLNNRTEITDNETSLNSILENQPTNYKCITVC